jgi:hypothetical protein
MSTGSTAEPIQVFISYRHANAHLLRDLSTSLGWLVNNSQIKTFDDRQILAGDDWDQVIKKELGEADIIILIVTADFMASSYCTQIELRHALERRAKDGTRIIPIIAEYCDWQALPIAGIAGLPKDDKNNLKPLNKWGRHRDLALTQIAQQVRQNVERLVDASLSITPATTGPATAVVGPRSPSPERLPDLTFVPIQGVNFVRLGPEKYVDNGQFSFELRLNLMSVGKPFVLIGFRADYIAPDGCYCLNSKQEILVNGTKAPTAGNFLDLQTPVPTNGIVQVACARIMRPPLMVQQPVDCDYGDVLVCARVLWDGFQPVLLERFFRFEVGGELSPIDSRRDPPLLSDRILAEMRTDGRITEEEFQRVTFLDAVDRYQVVRFPRHCTQVHPPTMTGFWDVTPEYRDFIIEINRRAFAEEVRREGEGGRNSSTVQNSGRTKQGGEPPRIDLGTAALIAKMTSDAVGAFDQICRGFVDVVKGRAPSTQPLPPPDFAYVNDPTNAAFVAKSRRTGAVTKTVSYAELCNILDDSDREYIETISQTMLEYQHQWNQVHAQRPLAIGSQLAQLDSQQKFLATQIGDELIRVLDFVQKMGFYLDDHYVLARHLAEDYLNRSNSGPRPPT